MNDQAIENEIKAKGLTAPRVTLDDLNANIASEFYFTATDGVLGASGMGTAPAGRAKSLNLLTFCVLVLRNGHTVTGESHCQDPAKFNAQTGREEARKDAVNKLWPMVVYAERERLSSQ